MYILGFYAFICFIGQLKMWHMQQTLAEGGLEPLTASKDSAFHG